MAKNKTDTPALRQTNEQSSELPEELAEQTRARLQSIANQARESESREVADDVLFFESENGQVIAYSRDILLYSPDGQKFYEFTQYGSEFNGKKTTKIAFKDKYLNKRGDLKIMEDEVGLDGTVYRKTEGRSKVDVVPIPEVRVLRYSFSLPDGDTIYVSDDKNSDTYDSLRFFINGEEVGILSAGFPIRNGTFVISTAKGILRVPLDKVATWNDVELKRLEPQESVQTVEDNALSSETFANFPYKVEMGEEVKTMLRKLNILFTADGIYRIVSNGRRINLRCEGEITKMKFEIVDEEREAWQVILTESDKIQRAIFEGRTLVGVEDE